MSAKSGVVFEPWIKDNLKRKGHKLFLLVLQMMLLPLVIHGQDLLEWNYTEDLKQGDSPGRLTVDRQTGDITIRSDSRGGTYAWRDLPEGFDFDLTAQMDLEDAKDRQTQKPSLAMYFSMGESISALTSPLWEFSKIYWLTFYKENFITFSPQTTPTTFGIDAPYAKKCYMRLKRVGHVLTASISLDGVVWRSTGVPQLPIQFVNGRAIERIGFLKNSGAGKFYIRNINLVLSPTIPLPHPWISGEIG